MSLIWKSIESLSKDDLEEAIRNGLSERQRLEYKLGLPGDSDGDKKEFLADVSSFANSSGGRIFYGIRADDGVPIEITGIDGSVNERDSLRLQNLIRDGLDPRAPQIRDCRIPIGDSRSVLVLDITRSWAAPHAVWYKRSGKFYKRHSSGKYQMDVDEIRSAFSAAATVAERAKAFHQSRLSKLLAGDAPIDLEQGAFLVIHALPFSAFDSRFQIDLQNANRHKVELSPIHGDVLDARWNFEGYLTSQSRAQGGFRPSYVQLYRSGIIEAVDSTMLRYWGDTLHARYLEQLIVNATRRYCSLLMSFDVPPPAFLAVTIRGVGNWSFNHSSGRYLSLDERRCVGHDPLDLPEVTLGSWDEDITLALRPAFDAMWNAAGYPRSFGYDEKGWNPPPPA